MKIVSCGAIPCFIGKNRQFRIVLGLEKGKWMPFKGRLERGESIHETASRELYEESARAISKSLHNHQFYCYSTRNKNNYLTVCKIYEKEYIRMKKNLENTRHLSFKYKEKEMIRSFTISSLLKRNDVHPMVFKTLFELTGTKCMQSLFSLKNGFKSCFEKSKSV